MKNQLQGTAAIADDLAACDFAVSSLTDFVGDALAGQGLSTPSESTSAQRRKNTTDGLEGWCLTGGAT